MSDNSYVEIRRRLAMARHSEGRRGALDQLTSFLEAQEQVRGG